MQLVSVIQLRNIFMQFKKQLYEFKYFYMADRETFLHISMTTLLHLLAFVTNHHLKGTEVFGSPLIIFF